MKISDDRIREIVELSCIAKEQWNGYKGTSPSVFKNMVGAIPELLSEREELIGDNMCDACAGTGEAISGKPCMCGGTGKMSDAAIYLREQLVEREREIGRLENQWTSVPDQYDNYAEFAAALIDEAAKFDTEFAAMLERAETAEKENERLEGRRDYYKNELALLWKQVGPLNSEKGK